jgi:hypothetical protein
MEVSASLKRIGDFRVAPSGVANDRNKGVRQFQWMQLNVGFPWSCSQNPTVAKVPVPSIELASLLFLAFRSSRSHGVPMEEETTRVILAVIERAPEWVRHDLASKDSGVRRRAEETLSAMISNALQQRSSDA